MAEEKKYYWIKLRDTFLTSDAVDFLMGQKNGSEYVVLYQMLCLKTANTGGEFVRTIGEVIIPYDADKIQRDCKYFSIDTVHIALTLYKKLALIYEQENGVLKIANFDKFVGKESNSNERVKRFREKQALLDSAKIPRIEKHINNKRYGGFYYEVLERDEYCCRNCKSKETIMVHHIIPYDPNDDDTVRKENLVTLCSSCHTSLHNKSSDKRIGLLPNKEILDAIGFDVTLQKRYDVTERDKILDTRNKDIKIQDKDISTILPDATSSTEPNKPVFITLSLISNEEYPITFSKLDELKPLYPAVNVEQSLRDMKGWLIGNPKNRKTKSGVMRFVTGWLSREQNKARPTSKSNGFLGDLKNAVEQGEDPF